MSETATPTASYLTQEAFDRLKAELDQLSGDGRTEIAKKIEAAREEGDLKENGGYHAAKEEQGKMEARIRQLTQLLENAIVGDEARRRRHRRARHGRHRRHVRRRPDLPARLARDRRRPTSRSTARSPPLGAAINGKKIGDKASYKAPNGKTIEVTVKDAKPYTG